MGTVLNSEGSKGAYLLRARLAGPHVRKADRLYRPDLARQTRGETLRSPSQQTSDPWYTVTLTEAIPVFAGAILMRSLRLLCAAGAIALRRPAALGNSRNNGDTVVSRSSGEPMSLNPMLENARRPPNGDCCCFSTREVSTTPGRWIGERGDASSVAHERRHQPGRATVTYHLRKNLRFADGVPLTARDCVWSIGGCSTPTTTRRADTARPRRQRQRPIVYAGSASQEPFGPLMTLVLAPQGSRFFPSTWLSRLSRHQPTSISTSTRSDRSLRRDAVECGDRVEMRPNPYYYRGAPKIPHLIVRFVSGHEYGDHLLAHAPKPTDFFDNQDRETYPELAPDSRNRHDGPRR